ncbi:hypothetical protein BDA96_09G172300 [Sorghum bicolor]|uniref:Uncharacterized protein n=1 Tax=Sorghum bicolor TaxID=4558 RepID=A0A921QB16_SORBI|nr:hypothetical protein BDA96_09G172300 [Sorghum bicolor]
MGEGEEQLQELGEANSYRSQGCRHSAPARMELPSTLSGRVYVLDCSPRSRVVCATQPRARRTGRRRC